LPQDAAARPDFNQIRRFCAVLGRNDQDGGIFSVVAASFVGL
jgi:hypothetical protein